MHRVGQGTAGLVRRRSGCDEPDSIAGFSGQLPNQCRSSTFGPSVVEKVARVWVARLIP
jgi:hypothetical protein